MKYIIESGVYIRKWKNLAMCRREGEKRGFELSAGEYKALISCDGRTELTADDTLYSLEARRLIRRFEGQKADIHPLPVREYPNIYIANIDWTITERCNYNCLHCFHASDDKRHREAFSRDEAFRLIRQARECGIRGIRLTGGEPMLWPWFWELLEELSKNGPALNTLITNGSLLDGDSISRIKKLHPGVQLMISFDGIGTHDWLRQCEGSQERILRSIGLCKEAGLKVKINMNVNRRSRDVIFESVKMLSDMKVDEIRLIKTTEAPRWQLNAADDSMTIEEYYDFSAAFAGQYKKSGLVLPVTIWQSLYLNGEKETFCVLPVKASVHDYRDDALICNAMHKKISVQANGDIIPCAPLAGVYTLRNIHPGNVKKEDLKKLLSQGALMDQVTQTVGKKRQTDKKCGECKYFKNCQGGCPALGLLFNQSLLAADDYKCAFFENNWYSRYCEVLDGWKNTNPIT